MPLINQVYISELAKQAKIALDNEFTYVFLQCPNSALHQGDGMLRISVVSSLCDGETFGTELDALADELITRVGAHNFYLTAYPIGGDLGAVETIDRLPDWTDVDKVTALADEAKDAITKVQTSYPNDSFSVEAKVGVGEK